MLTEIYGAKTYCDLSAKPIVTVVKKGVGHVPRPKGFGIKKSPRRPTNSDVNEPSDYQYH
jgi:hypothetical protein